jgi:hypothetical protein
MLLLLVPQQRSHNRRNWCGTKQNKKNHPCAIVKHAGNTSSTSCLTISPCSSQSSIKSYTSKRPSSFYSRHQRLGSAISEVIRPFSKARLHISRYALKHDCRDRNEWPIFHARGNDAVILGEEESRGESVGLGLRQWTDDATRD